jgi:hypothetical protein
VLTLAVVITVLRLWWFVGSLYVISLALLYVQQCFFIVNQKRIGGCSLKKEIILVNLYWLSSFLLLIRTIHATEVVGIHALFWWFMMGCYHA